MSLTAGQKLHGFTVTRVREVAELSANLVEMSHDKTGAQLVWVDNGESNKLFSIAFKTLPEDSTGVFHILEHSVLCGSDKFPVKEPFVELLKSSMNTFLNAMTFPDKTMYPVSSRNDQDFMNLTEVYLDAVFAPAIRHNKNIFYQEGWHVEMENARGILRQGLEGDGEELVALAVVHPAELCAGLVMGHFDQVGAELGDGADAVNREAVQLHTGSQGHKGSTPFHIRADGV